MNVRFLESSHPTRATAKTAWCPLLTDSNLTRGPADLAMGNGARIEPLPGPVAAETGHFLTEEEFRATERENLIAALRSANWRVWGPDGAAAMLGIKPSTLSYRMSAFDIRKGL